MPSDKPKATKLTAPSGKPINVVNNRGGGGRAEFKPHRQGKMPGNDNPWAPSD